jgi:hypothetical protein
MPTAVPGERPGMAERGYYEIPILESESGYESPHSVVFSGSDEQVLDRLSLTFDSIRCTSGDSADKAIRSVYKENLREYQKRFSDG